MSVWKAFDDDFIYSKSFRQAKEINFLNSFLLKIFGLGLEFELAPYVFRRPRRLSHGLKIEAIRERVDERDDEINTLELFKKLSTAHSPKRLEFFCLQGSIDLRTTDHAQRREFVQWIMELQKGAADSSHKIFMALFFYKIVAFGFKKSTSDCYKKKKSATTYHCLVQISG